MPMSFLVSHDAKWGVVGTQPCYQFVMGNYKHGHMTDQRFGTPTYNTWKAMKKRCLNVRHAQYPNYGGRGIKICDRWLGDHGFENFLADMGVRPRGKTIDRINNNGNYEPGNCRWATVEQQNANQRPYKNWKLDYSTAQIIRSRVNSGESRKDVAADVGISYSQITKIMLGMRWPSSTKEKK